MFFKQFNLFFQTFQTLILFSFIKYIKNSNKLPFQNSKAIKLLNNNILVVHAKGIDIYDCILNNSISEEIKFEEDSDVLKKFNFAIFNKNNDNDFIFIIKSKNIYIVNINNGSLIYEEKNSSIINKLQDKYQCLTPIKKENNTYSYMIAFKKSTYGYITSLFFKCDKDQNKNNFLYSNDYNLNEKIKYDIISCEVMLDQINNEIIVCFYVCEDDTKLGTFYINPYNYTKIEKDKKIKKFSSNIKGLKSNFF